MSNTPSNLLRPSLLALAVAGAMQPAQLLADTAPTVAKETIEVVGQSYRAADKVITNDLITKTQADDLAETFKTISEVDVRSGPGLSQKLYVRGIQDPLLDISVDGAAQVGNNFHHTGRITIDPDLLKRVEVTSGTGDATSGMGALGGSIKFVTKDPEDLLEAGQGFGGILKGSYHSNTDSFQPTATLFGSFNADWSAMASFSKADTEDYETGGGDEVEGSGADQKLGFAKLVGHINDAQTVRLSHEKLEDEGERAQRPEWIISSFNPLYPIETERETTNFSYHLNPSQNDMLNLEVALFDTSSTTFQNGRFGPFNGETSSHGVRIENTSALDAHELTYGAEYREDKAEGEGTTEYAKEEGEVYALFLQDKFQATERLILNSGLRYDHYELNDSSDVDRSSSGFSPNAGFDYQITPAVSVFGSHAEAHKGLIVRETFLSTFVSIGDDVEEQEAKTQELGVRYEEQGLSLSAKIYKTEITNMTNRAGSTHVNAGDLDSKGLVLEASKQWRELTAGLSFHANDAEVDGDDANAYDHSGAANTIGNTLIANLDYQINPELAIGWVGNFVQGEDDIDTSAGEINKPGYAVHDVYAQWTPANIEQLTVNFGINNLFDKEYLDHASVGDFTEYFDIAGYAAPGRDVRLSVAWKF